MTEAAGSFIFESMFVIMDRGQIERAKGVVITVRLFEGVILKIQSASSVR